MKYCGLELAKLVEVTVGRQGAKAGAGFISLRPNPRHDGKEAMICPLSVS